MTATDVMAVGGTGAGLQLGLRLIGMASSGLSGLLKTNREIQAAKDKAELDLWSKIKEETKNQLNGAGAWVYRMFAVVATIVVLSTILIPLFGDVTVHFYAPKEAGWWVFKKDLLQEYTFGAGSKHIALFPYQVSFCLNVAWFYICGRPLKHRF